LISCAIWHRSCDTNQAKRPQPGKFFFLFFLFFWGKKFRPAPSKYQGKHTLVDPGRFVMQPNTNEKPQKGMLVVFSGATKVILAALFILFACQSGVSSIGPVMGSGIMASQSRDLPEFHSVVFKGRGSLYLTQGERRGVVIETDDNLLKKYRSRVEDGILYLGFKKAGRFSPTRVEVRLNAEQLKAITLNGSGRLVGLNTITGDAMMLRINGSGDASLKTLIPKMRVRINGSGDANLHLMAEGLEVTSSGSGVVRLSGRADNQYITLSGSGDYLADSLMNQKARIRITGSSDARLWVLGRLDASLMGSGNLYYKGRPKIDSDLLGSGKLKTLY
jgi:hypothetical protein